MRAIMPMLAALGALFGGLLVADTHEFLGWVSKRIVGRASRLLPPHQRAVRREEWLAELEAFEGMRLLKFFWSVGIVFAAGRIAVSDARAIKSGEVEPRGKITFGLVVKPGQRPTLYTISHISQLDQFDADVQEELRREIFETDREYVAPWYVPWYTRNNREPTEDERERIRKLNAQYHRDESRPEPWAGHGILRRPRGKRAGRSSSN